MIKLPPKNDFSKGGPLRQPLDKIRVIAMRMRTSYKLKMQGNIASMSLNILADNFQPRMEWNISIAINAWTHVDFQ